MNKKKLDIIFSCDSALINPLITIINSILTNTSSKNNLTFNIVCDDVDFFIEKLQILKTIHKSNNFTFNCVSVKSLDKNELNFISKYCFSSDKHTNSLYNFIRYWFHYLFPNLDYIVYLDIDMIIEGDIFELANLEFNNNKFFASTLCTIYKPTYTFKNMHINGILLKTFNVKNTDLAFNAGLFVTSLSFWKKYNILVDLKNIVKLRYENKKLYSLGTQPPLNLVFRNKMLFLDKYWMVPSLGESEIVGDAMYAIIQGKAKCLHWTGTLKPWNSDRFSAIYSKYHISI